MLGDSRGDLIDSKGSLIEDADLTDLLTPQSYNSDFVISDADYIVMNR
jgi:hypothetical protein